MDPRENAGSKKMEIFKAQGTYLLVRNLFRPAHMAGFDLCQKLSLRIAGVFPPRWIRCGSVHFPDTILPVCCMAVLMSLGVTRESPWVWRCGVLFSSGTKTERAGALCHRNKKRLNAKESSETLGQPVWPGS